MRRIVGQAERKRMRGCAKSRGAPAHGQVRETSPDLATLLPRGASTRKGKMSESFYTRSAEFYNLIHAGKAYADEAAAVHAHIQAHLRSGGNALLDVACGTGNHAAHLRQHYRVDGL